MMYKSNELFVVTIAKVIEVNDNTKRKNVKFRYKSKFYIAKLMKVGKNCCVFKLLTKNILVLDNNKLVNNIGEYYINYKEALNLATGMYKKTEYSYEEIEIAEKKINKDREVFIK